MALLIAAVAVVVVVFLLVRPSDEGPAPTTSAGGATTSTEASPGEEKPKPKPEPKPSIARIDVVDGEPKGAVAKIEVDSGEAIEFTVTSDVPEEIHVHGFDLYEDVGPGQKAAFDFPADLEGIFEVELHGSAVQIAELRVNP
ncbi:MAG: hypothetical protein H0U42_02550 [Thermoleophilaceae bacterium]|nr:hypothetical protein [Thermoleophilaceae bacterium]